AELGAFDYLAKPFDLDDMLAAAERALARPADREAARAAARAQREERLPLIGRSRPMQEVYRSIARLVGADLTVLIVGESGTGKELAARALHDLGPRREGRFASLNLAALPRERVEEELFGKEGKYLEADGGVLFLDGVGDLPLDSQGRLLRVFDGAETPINPRTGRRPSVRVIAAADRDLSGLVAEGLFREDLFFRLNVASLRMPPLREHPEDIGDLAHAFLLRAHREGLAAKSIDKAAIERLKRHRWPGNVRELENLIRRICALHPEETIDEAIIERELFRGPQAEGGEGGGLSEVVEEALAAQFAAHQGALPPPGLHHRVIAAVERPLFALTIAATKGNQLRAAEILGLNRNTLRKKISELGIAVRRSG
ncbi:MAG: sigma-54-dependent transcriptional regulator, partial [Caulobacteraceae bacterium]